MSKRAGGSDAPAADGKKPKQKHEPAAAAAASSASSAFTAAASSSIAESQENATAATASGIPTCPMLSLVQQLSYNDTLTVLQIDALCCPACRLAEQLHHMHWSNGQLIATLDSPYRFGEPDSGGELSKQFFWLWMRLTEGTAEADAELYSDAPDCTWIKAEVKVRGDIERFMWTHAIRPVLDEQLPAKLSQLIGSYWSIGTTQQHVRGEDGMEGESSSSSSTPSR